ncbi:hypothetical protein GCM10023187_26460 [Nibrella viscosa]|uniref:FecR family protein n=1 Tax=Nibrella viscosa TaxID=1084524 RepID=A0ABP8KGJ8_9BACT
MNHQAFLELLQRYIDGTCSPEEKQVMDYWYSLLGRDADEKPANMPKAQLEDLLWEKIQHRIHPEAEPVEPLVVRRWWQSRYAQLAAAASVVLVAGLIYLLAMRRQAEPIQWEGAPVAVSDLHQESNSSSASRVIQLEDGSRITLGRNSQVYYPKPFANNQRVVYLTGNAFFEVTKNPKRPFMVYTGTLLTKVVGTSFSIRSTNNHLEVAVITGKVIVEKATSKPAGQASAIFKAGDNGVVLTPNQKVTFFPKNGHFITGLIENPIPIIKPETGAEEAPVSPKFRFDDTPLADALTEIEAAYGIDIVVGNEAIADCPITADLSQQPLYTKLEIICTALKAHYEVKGTRIILTGGNCH